MKQHSEQNVPRVPSVGVVALTRDSWSGLWTTRHFMLSNLAKIFRVVWVEPPRHWRNALPSNRDSTSQPGRMAVWQVETSGVGGVTKIQPFAWLPDFYRPARIRSLVRAMRYARAARSLRNAGCEQVLLHIWRPDFVDALDSRSHFDAVIYHIDDEYNFSDEVSPISLAEQRLLEESDAVILHSSGLAERKGHINKHTHLVPNGVDFGWYSRNFEIPGDLQAIPGPRIGYAGVIRSHLDISLMRQLAEKCPDWSFVLVGPLGSLAGYETQMAAMSKLPNVHLLGHRDARELPAYQQHFDVCIMPYRVTAYTNCIYPLKMHEYLAGGRPVIGTPVRTLLEFDHVVDLASDVDGWIEAIRSNLAAEANDPAKVATRRAVAAEHDWTVLAEKTALIMASVLDADVEQLIRATTNSSLGQYSTQEPDLS